MALVTPDSQVHGPAVDYESLLVIGRQLLIALGEDPDRPGLRDTPRRFADMWREFIEYQPGTLSTVFESVATDQLVIVSGMRVWSMCEHHMLPFWCDISIGYIARDSVLGLSKFGRIAQLYAHRLQLQEQLIHQIADHVEGVTQSPDVAVIGVGEHLCMTSRGVRSPHRMTSSIMRGVFRESSPARSELLQLLAKQ